jgi:hypothetical protein
MDELQIIAKGTYLARAVSCTTDTNADKTKECFVVKFSIDSGEHAGTELYYRGWLTEKTVDRTLDSLRYCGWDSDDVTDVLRPEIISRKQVSLSVEVDEYQGRLKNVVAWVNDPSRRPKGSLDNAAAKLLAARLKGAAIASRNRVGVPAPVAAKAPAQMNTVDAQRKQLQAEHEALLAKAAALKAGFVGDDEPGSFDPPF